MQVGLHYYKLIQTNFLSVGILYAHFNVFNKPSMFYVGFIVVQ